MPPPEEVFDNPTAWVARDIRRYVESDRHRLYGHDALLLTTRGRRSGKLRRTAVWYVRDGDRYLLVGSSGAGRDPAWVHNVRAHPAVVLQVRGDVFAGLARLATGDERTRLWQRVAAEIPRYARTRRPLPLVIVEPA